MTGSVGRGRTIQNQSQKIQDLKRKKMYLDLYLTIHTEITARNVKNLCQIQEFKIFIGVNVADFGEEKNLLKYRKY